MAILRDTILDKKTDLVWEKKSHESNYICKCVGRPPFLDLCLQNLISKETQNLWRTTSYTTDKWLSKETWQHVKSVISTGDSPDPYAWISSLRQTFQWGRICDAARAGSNKEPSWLGSESQPDDALQTNLIPSQGWNWCLIPAHFSTSGLIYCLFVEISISISETCFRNLISFELFACFAN